MTKLTTEEVYQNIKDIANKNQVIVVIPSTPIKDTSSINNIDIINSPSKMNASYNYVQSSGNMLCISPIASGKVTIKVLKSRNDCAITLLIKNKDKEGLKNYLNSNEVLSMPQEYAYPTRLLNNLVYVIHHDLPEYVEIIQSSERFKQFITNKPEFIMKVAVKADNYAFLMKNINIENLLDNKNFINELSMNSSMNILEELLKNENFKSRMEQIFNLLEYLPNKTFDMIIPKIKVLEVLQLIVSKISLQEKKLNLKSIFQEYSNASRLDNVENIRYLFNETLKVFILHSDYIFKEDMTIDGITQDNQNLINKKILNNNLSNRLPLRQVMKKPKI